MRNDGKLPDILREIKIIPNFIQSAEGPVLIETGNTKVICTASIEEQPRPLWASKPSAVFLFYFRAPFPLFQESGL